MTAVLAADNASAPRGRTLVYVLGMSHVSRRSVEQVDQLIRMVRFHCDPLCSPQARPAAGLHIDKPPAFVSCSRSSRLRGSQSMQPEHAGCGRLGLLGCRPLLLQMKMRMFGQGL